MAALDPALLAQLAQQMTDTQLLAGVRAMVVADHLADGDVDAARAALPAYQEAAALHERMGGMLARVAGLDTDHP